LIESPSPSPLAHSQQQQAQQSPTMYPSLPQTPSNISITTTPVVPASTPTSNPQLGESQKLDGVVNDVNVKKNSSSKQSKKLIDEAIDLTNKIATQAQQMKQQQQLVKSTASIVSSMLVSIVPLLFGLFLVFMVLQQQQAALKTVLNWENTKVTWFAFFIGMGTAYVQLKFLSEKNK